MPGFESLHIHYTLYTLYTVVYVYTGYFIYFLLLENSWGFFLPIFQKRGQ
jgi:hypothetical protein